MFFGCFVLTSSCYICRDTDGKGVPTLKEITELSLPPSDPVLHPSRKAKTYAAYRKSQHYKSVKDCVEALTKDRIAKILSDASKAEDWEDQQEAIDALFEALQEEARDDPSMDILSKHPSFPSWVDRGLEEVLQASQRRVLKEPLGDPKTDTTTPVEAEESEENTDALEASDTTQSSSSSSSSSS